MLTSIQSCGIFGQLLFVDKSQKVANMVNETKDLGPARKVSLAVEIADRLRACILEGTFAQGDRLREGQLAASFEVSRAPIRQALATLEQEGLVVARPRRGTYVARLSHKDVLEVYTLRLVLERLAIEFAILNATDNDIAAISEVVEAMAKGTADGTTEQESMALDIEFHDRVYRAARHERLYDSWSKLKSQTQVLLLSANVANPSFALGTLERHRDVLDALRSRNVPEAIRVMEDHLRWTYVHMMKWYGGSRAEGTNIPLPGAGQHTARPVSDLMSPPLRSHTPSEVAQDAR